MDLVYKVRWPHDGNQVSLGHRGIVVFSWSSSNLFAFTIEKQVNGFSKQYLNVFNPNQPWDVFKTLYKGGEITCIQWDHTGTKFLTGDSHGLCCIWSMPNSVTNMWSPKTRLSVDLKGEEILAVGWLHHGTRVLFNIERLDAPYAAEKFDRMKFKPSVMQFGGKPMEGFILVTGTGLVAVHLFKSESEVIKGEVHLNVPCHQQLATITYTSQGKILILTTDGNINHLIQFHEVSLKFDSDDGKLNIEVHSLPGLPLRAASEDPCPYTHISHASFFSRENEERFQVVVCISGPTGSRLETWMMRNDASKVHQKFQSMLPAILPQARSWQFVKDSPDLPRVTGLSLPPLMTVSSEGRNVDKHKFYCGWCIAVALADNTVQVLHGIYLNTLVTKQLPERSRPVVTSSGKRSRVSEESGVGCAVFSPMTCSLMTVDDEGSLLCYKLDPWLTSGWKCDSEPAMKQLVHLLVYCLFTGQDWWDVLLHVKPRMVDTIINQLSNEVMQQPAHQQQILQSRLHSMKITLYHLHGNPASMDYHLILLFDAISLVFRSLLRPHQQVSTEDADPAIRLKAVGFSSTESDIDKLLQTVDSDPQTLQSMQQLIQWVVDVALYLLASAPITLYQKQMNRPGATLYRNRTWLSLLREMLVVIRVWGLLKSACSPVFTLLDSKLDVLAHTFRLVTSLWQTCGEMKEPDQSVMSECSLLSCQLVIPPLEVIAPPSGVLNHLRTYTGEANFVFGEFHDDAFLTAGRQQTMEYVNFGGSSGKIDALRRLFLGKSPNQDMKECTRCGITTTYNNLPMKSLKVWDKRFGKNCLCGGHWKLVSANPSYHS